MPTYFHIGTMRSFITVFGRTRKYEHDGEFGNFQKYDKI